MTKRIIALALLLNLFTSTVYAGRGGGAFFGGLVGGAIIGGAIASRPRETVYYESSPTVVYREPRYRNANSGRIDATQEQIRLIRKDIEAIERRYREPYPPHISRKLNRLYQRLENLENALDSMLVY